MAKDRTIRHFFATPIGSIGSEEIAPGGTGIVPVALTEEAQHVAGLEAKLKVKASAGEPVLSLSLSASNLPTWAVVPDPLDPLHLATAGLSEVRGPVTLFNAQVRVPSSAALGTVYTPEAESFLLSDVQIRESEETPLDGGHGHSERLCRSGEGRCHPG